MKNIEVLQGAEGPQLVVVGIVESSLKALVITDGVAQIRDTYKMVVLTGHGYYDSKTDDFGDGAEIVIDKLTDEHADRIKEKLDGFAFYHGHDGVVEDNKKHAVELIKKILLGENPPGPKEAQS